MNRSPRRSILMPSGASSPSPYMHRKISPALSVSSSISSSRDRDDASSTTSDLTGIKDQRAPTSITVSIRLKPVVSNSQTTTSSWSATSTSIASPDVGSFSFDHVFSPAVTSKDVYCAAAKRIVSSVLDGYHATIFAYGMTGTGKTFSMQGTPQSPGIIPLAIADIFSQLSFATTSISISYLEIYNERVKDLLNPSVPSEELKLHDTPSGLVRVRNLRCVRTATERELRDLIAQGDSARKTEGTEYNQVSSRSHAVLQIYLERVDPLTAATSTSVLSLCDLAGSERAATDSERRKEGAYINRSLLALGTIIARLSALSTEKAGGESRDHIPYRDSKLTRLLQHSLSGGALVFVLCTVDTHSTSKHGVTETVNTLRFAARAKNVAVTPVRAMTASVTTSAAANAIIESLRLDIERERAETEVLKVELADARREAYEARLRDKEKHDGEMRELEIQRDALKDKVSHLTRLILGGGGVGLTGPPMTSDKRVVSAGVLSNEPTENLEFYRSKIKELEKKLSMTSVSVKNATSPSALPMDIMMSQKLKDAESEIKELKEYLSDKDRMISVLKRATALPTAAPTSVQPSPAPRPYMRQSSFSISKEHDKDEDYCPLRSLDTSELNIDSTGIDLYPDESLVVPKLRRPLK
ncbi:kinesin-like protein KIP2 [Lipomyces arxii]|uniref:kinesin-like protein KIP2 n=1 Tax=Lipomyces arxii TaxID=56418 RepID=UPI0034D0179D